MNQSGRSGFSVIIPQLAMYFDGPCVFKFGFLDSSISSMQAEKSVVDLLASTLSSLSMVMVAMERFGSLLILSDCGRSLSSRL